MTRPLRPATSHPPITRACRGVLRRLPLGAALALHTLAAAEPRIVDFRYAPPEWQTCIGLPDDWQKTLVGKDGSLLYDYPGGFSGFGLKLSAGLDDDLQWDRQTLESPRIPIVRTVKQVGTLHITEEVFAAVPGSLPAPSKHPTPLALQRQSEFSVLTNWANPPTGTDPAFRNVAVGWNHPIQLRCPVPRGDSFTVVFGLCEGWHTNAGVRLLDLRVENRSRATCDLVREPGRNRPHLVPITASDEDNDGWLEFEVAPASGTTDRNTLLNRLWVFPGTEPVDLATLAQGQPSRVPLATTDFTQPLPWSREPRYDVWHLRYHNAGAWPLGVRPVLRIETGQSVQPPTPTSTVTIGDQTVVQFPETPVSLTSDGPNHRLQFGERSIPAGATFEFAFAIQRSGPTPPPPFPWPRLDRLRRQAMRFWDRADLPYDRLTIPDPGVQALVDASIRNIYQAREIKHGLPAFQVGPTCYRGLWVVDGSFLMEAVAFLGRTTESRQGIQYLLGFQRDDGGFMLIDGHWKETGIVLWAVTRHARLTGDKAWLESVWPRLERGFAYIQSLRRQVSQDPQAPGFGLVPDGFSDGGLGEVKPEYTNPYWTLIGLRAAAQAARWLGHLSQADAWDTEYHDGLAAFRRAAQRDLQTDAHGNRYLPVRMRDRDGIAPQRAQWAFLHAVYPGQVFAADDPLVTGNLAMLAATEQEDMVFGTGWIADGLWNYFASFYGHAWLWVGRQDKAIQSLYAMANHASPLFAWREEHMPRGQGPRTVGDMPHNWASAEFLRFVRHTLVLEREDELHLAEALPREWLVPGKSVRLDRLETDFGPLSLDLDVARDGRTVQLKLTCPNRQPPRRTFLHLDGWSSQSGTLELPTRGDVRRTIPLHSAPR